MMMLFRMNRTPIEVTSLDRRGALLNGRYATISIMALKNPHALITIRSTMSIAGRFLPKLLLSSTPTVPSKWPDKTAPVIKTYPWGRLIRPIELYESVKPSAIRA
jgi:hypothetical protein